MKKNSKKKQTKKKLYKVNKTKSYIGIAALVCLLLVMVTYRFIEFSSSEVQNNAMPSRITYNITPSETISLTNVYPIDSEGLMEDTENNKSITITFNGSTTEDEDYEYLIKFDQVDNTINGKSVPIAYVSAFSNLGEESVEYFTDRGKESNVFMVNESGHVYSNEVLLVGYIKKGEANYNGSITVTAYVDANQIEVFGEEDYGDIGDYYFQDPDYVADQVNFTPEEWDEIITRGVSFKVRIEIQKGTWVIDQ